MGHDTRPKPVWISHRGIRGEGVLENTTESFQAALRAGFKHLETDLQLTADGHIVLCHDTSFSRLSDDPRPIEELRRSQIERLRLRTGQSILFFDQFAEQFRDAAWVLDIKPPQEVRCLEVLRRWAVNNGRLDEILGKAVFLVWTASATDALTRLFPTARRYARRLECYRAGLTMVFGKGLGAGLQADRVYALTPRFVGVSLFSPRIVDGFHQRGAKVIAFLPGTEDEFQADSGCDEILSDGFIRPD
jgi:glycerophosphoryl diester phosphodiesterase